MPGPDGPWGDGAAGRGRAPARSTRRRSTTRSCGSCAWPLASARWRGPRPRFRPTYDDDEVAATLRRVAAAGFVLARNERGLLPLEASALRAGRGDRPERRARQDPRRWQRDGVPALHGVPARWSARGARARRRRSSTASACRRATGSPWRLRPGCTCPARAGPGSSSGSSPPTAPLVASERRARLRVQMARSSASPPTVARIEVRTVIRATEPGTYTIGASGLGHYRLSIDREEVFDERLELPPGADIVEGLMVPAAGRPHLELRRRRGG